jgi:AraC-like DNA-binding protein
MDVRITPTDGRYRARVRRQWIDDLALVDCDCGPFSAVRGPSWVAASDREFVAVLITRQGRETLAHRRLRKNLGSGDVVVWDSIQPGRFTAWEDLSKRTLLVPRVALSEFSGGHHAVGGVILNAAAPATRLLTGYLGLLSQTLGELRPGEVSAARNATLELLVGAVCPSEASSSPVAVGLRSAMDAWIERHINPQSGCQTVTPAAIASGHGVSVRSVHRVFAATGQTVGGVIRLRRLARARAELSARDDPISVIARRWGFSDSSHFCKVFRDHYGSTPSEYRASQTCPPNGR